MTEISAGGLDFEDALEEDRLELMVGRSGHWRESRDFQLRALEKLGLQCNHHLLDVGCGPLRAGAPLIRFLDPVGYTGIDISADRLHAARKVVAHFGLEDKNPRLLTSKDFGRDCLPRASFDRVWCYQVVIHLASPLVEQFMSAVAELLKPEGRAWFSARVLGDGDDFNTVGAWQEFPVAEAGEAFYRSSANAAGLDCTGLGTLGEWGLSLTRRGAKNWLFELRPAL
jgi:SAM-dependent methyltransferase